MISNLQLVKNKKSSMRKTNTKKKKMIKKIKSIFIHINYYLAYVFFFYHSYTDKSYRVQIYIFQLLYCIGI